MRWLGLTVFFLSWIEAAHAYIDPGTSLLLMQGLLAAVGGLLFFVRHPIQALKKLLSRFKRKQ